MPDSLNNGIDPTRKPTNTNGRQDSNSTTPENLEHSLFTYFTSLFENHSWLGLGGNSTNTGNFTNTGNSTHTNSSPNTGNFTNPGNSTHTNNSFNTGNFTNTGNSTGTESSPNAVEKWGYQPGPIGEIKHIFDNLVRDMRNNDPADLTGFNNVPFRFRIGYGIESIKRRIERLGGEIDNDTIRSFLDRAASGVNDYTFDKNKDGVVDSDDLLIWANSPMSTNLGRPHPGNESI